MHGRLSLRKGEGEGEGSFKPLATVGLEPLTSILSPQQGERRNTPWSVARTRERFRSELLPFQGHAHGKDHFGVPVKNWRFHCSKQKLGLPRQRTLETRASSFPRILCASLWRGTESLCAPGCQ